MIGQRTPPSGVSVVYHFDLTVEVFDDGSASAGLSDPGTLGGTIATSYAETAERALEALAAAICLHDVDAPDPYRYETPPWDQQ